MNDTYNDNLEQLIINGDGRVSLITYSDGFD